LTTSFRVRRHGTIPEILDTENGKKGYGLTIVPDRFLFEYERSTNTLPIAPDIVRRRVALLAFI
jgi:hypothetical protein